jgi:hypothetical protein
MLTSSLCSKAEYCSPILPTVRRYEAVSPTTWQSNAVGGTEGGDETRYFGARRESEAAMPLWISLCGNTEKSKL